MNILLFVSNFPPEISTGRLEYELSFSLSKSNNIFVVTLFPRKYLTKKEISNGFKLFYYQKQGEISVLRIAPTFTSRDDIIQRGIEYYIQFFSFILGGILSKKCDIIICSSPPLTVALAGCFISKMRKIPFILRVGDIHPDELIDLGLIKNIIIKKSLLYIERFVYNESDKITVLSNGYKENLIKKGVNESKILIIPNWSDTSKVKIINKDQARKDLNLKEYNDKIIFTYAGSMSWHQDILTILETAYLLKDKDKFIFFIIGDGPQKKSLINWVNKYKLTNVIFFPFQDPILYFKYIQASDACFVALKREAKTTTIPSKILDILACQRPIIAIVPKGEVSLFISSIKCGFWIEPQNPTMLKDILLTFNTQNNIADGLAMNGYNYLMEHLTLESAQKNYISIINSLFN